MDPHEIFKKAMKDVEDDKLNEIKERKRILMEKQWEGMYKSHDALIKCERCGHVWNSGRTFENLDKPFIKSLKCELCGISSILYFYIFEKLN